MRQTVFFFAMALVLAAIIVRADGPTSAKTPKPDVLPEACRPTDESRENMRLALHPRPGNLPDILLAAKHLYRQNERLNALIESKDEVYRACLADSQECACRWELAPKGIAIACAPNETGLIAWFRRQSYPIDRD